MIKSNDTTVIIKSSIDLDCNYDTLRVKTNATEINLCNANSNHIAVNGDFELIFKSDEIVDGPKTGFELLLSDRLYDLHLCRSICYCWGDVNNFNLGCKFSKASF